MASSHHMVLPFRRKTLASITTAGFPDMRLVDDEVKQLDRGMFQVLALDMLHGRGF